MRNYLCKIHKIKKKYNKNRKNTNIYIIQETYNIKGIGLVFYGYQKKGDTSRNDVIKIGPIGGQFYNIHIRNVRDVLDNDVDTLYEGQLGCLAIKQLSKEIIFKRDHIKRGIFNIKSVLLSTICGLVFIYYIIQQQFEKIIKVRFIVVV